MYLFGCAVRPSAPYSSVARSNFFVTAGSDDCKPRDLERSLCSCFGLRSQHIVLVALFKAFSRSEGKVDWIYTFANVAPKAFLPFEMQFLRILCRDISSISLLSDSIERDGIFMIDHDCKMEFRKKMSGFEHSFTQNWGLKSYFKLSFVYCERKVLYWVVLRSLTKVLSKLFTTTCRGKRRFHSKLIIRAVQLKTACF